MNPFRNRYVVICLGVVALLMLLNSFKPLWQHGRPPKGWVKAQEPAAVPAPVQPASNTPATPAARLQSEAEESRRGIEFSRVGWSFNGAPRHDPFQIIGPSPSNFARIYPSAMEVLTLSAVWWQSGTILAVINTNHVVREGDMIKGVKGDLVADFKIINIGVERIWVDGPNGREQVLFDPTLSLRGISINLGKALDDSFAGAKAHLDWPYRMVNGITNDIHRDPGWESFSGKVVKPLEQGKYLVDTGAGQLFILKGVPLDLVKNDELPRGPRVWCKYVGTDTYQSGGAPVRVSGGSAEALEPGQEKARAFDFGAPCSPPKEALDGLKFQKSLILQQYKEANERRVKLELQDAEKGDATAQYMLGRRYLYGDGIPKNEPEARRWLEASALQGNPDARAKLQSLASQIDPITKNIP